MSLSHTQKLNAFHMNVENLIICLKYERLDEALRNGMLKSLSEEERSSFVKMVFSAFSKSFVQFLFNPSSSPDVVMPYSSWGGRRVLNTLAEHGVFPRIDGEIHWSAASQIIQKTSKYPETHRSSYLNLSEDKLISFLDDLHCNGANIIPQNYTRHPWVSVAEYMDEIIADQARALMEEALILQSKSEPQPKLKTRKI